RVVPRPRDRGRRHGLLRHRDHFPDTRDRPRVRELGPEPGLHARPRDRDPLRGVHHSDEPRGRHRAGVDEPEAAFRMTPQEPDLERGHSPWSDAWQRLRRNRLALAGAVALLVLGAACAAGPFFSQSYREQSLDLGATPPSWAHWLGTDTLGRDLLARVLYGGRISITVGLVATFVALVIGVTYGAVA